MQRWMGWGRNLLSLGLVIVLAYWVAQTGWLLWYGPQDTVPADQRVRLMAAGGGGEASTLTQSQVEKWQLFGEFAAQRAPAAAPTEAPETRLSLTLLGVFLASDVNQATAIIAEKGKPGELYHIGDAIAGNATLEEVYADRVILRRSGRLETLRWSESTLQGVQSAPSRRAAPVTRQPSPQAATSSEEDNELVRQRRTLIRQLGLKPGEDASGGYRIGKRAPKALLAQVGLQPDDVIVSVNGLPLGTEENDLAAMRSFQQTQQASIVVTRQDQQFTVNYPP